MRPTQASKKLLSLAALLCTIGLTSRAQTYCTPTHTVPGSLSCASGNARIYSLNIAGDNGTELSDAPPCSPDYKDRTSAVAPLSMSPGGTYYGTVGITYIYTSYAIWIDLDDDGVFSAAERLSAAAYPNQSYMSPYLNVYPYYYVTYPVAINMPASAPAGNHRMRVRAVYTANNNPVLPEPCASTGSSQSFYYGSSADYLVYIATAPCTPASFTTLAGNPAVCPGSSASFAVNTDQPSASLQWQVDEGSGFADITNGSVYSGATGNTLSVANTTAAMTGFKYRCKATYNGCVSFSNTGVLAVRAPRINTQPSNRTCVPGTTGVFITVVVGSFPNVVTSYQWQADYGQGFTNLVNDNNYTGATGAALSLKNVPLSFSGTKYRCFIIQNGCSTTSGEATLTVVPNPDPQYKYAPATTLGAVSNPFGAATNSRYQALYTPGDLANATPGVIKHIYLKSTSFVDAPTVYSNVEIKMGSTTLTSLSGFQTGLTTVYTAASDSLQPQNQQWFGFELATPFYYDPSKSLLIEFSYTNRTGQLISCLTGSGHSNPSYTGPCAVYQLGNIPTVYSSNTPLLFGVDIGACLTVTSQPANKTVSTDAGSCSASGVSLGVPVATSACGTVTYSNDAPAVFPKGTTVVTWVVTDGRLTDSFTQAVTVADSIAPVIACPANITVTADAGNCNAAVNYTAPTATDNCSAVVPVRTAGPASGSLFAAGNTTISYTATDADGNTSSCSFTVTVIPQPAVATISVTPSNNTYTGGVPTNIYLGYGPQSAVIAATMQPGTGYTYSWSPATNLGCSNCANPVFTPTTAGNYTYTVTATNASGCSVATSVSFCVQDVRVPNGNNKVYLCHNGNTLAISPNAVPGHLNNHAADRLGNCNTSCGSANKNSYSEEGGYAMMGGETEDAGIKIYPNPNNGQFTIALPPGIDNAEISVMDMTGKLILKQRSAGSGHISISLDNIARGVYMVNISDGIDIHRSKITIQ